MDTLKRIVESWRWKSTAPRGREARSFRPARVLSKKADRCAPVDTHGPVRVRVRERLAAMRTAPESSWAREPIDASAQALAPDALTRAATFELRTGGSARYGPSKSISNAEQRSTIESFQ